MAVSVPVRTKYDASGLSQLKREIRENQKLARLSAKLERDITKEQNAQIRATKQQIAQRKRLNSLSRRLERSLARDRRGPLGGFAGQVGLGAAAGAAGGLIAAEAARRAVDFAKNAEEQGRAAEAAQAKLTSLLGSTEAYNRAIAEAQEITGGLVSKTKLAEGEFLLLDAGIAKNTQQAAKLAEAGSILNTTFEQQGASSEKFIRLLSGGNRALFDNYNLTLSQVNARKAQIESEGELSGEQAKLAAIQELLIEKADDLKGSMTDSEKAAKDLEAASDDLAAAVGTNLTPSFTASREALAKMERGIAGLFDAVGRGNDAIIESAKDYDDYKQKLFEATNGNATLLRRVGLTEEAFWDQKEALEAARKAQDAKTKSDELAAAAAEKAAAAEERRAEAEARAAKRRERVADIRRKTTLQLFEIDEQAQEKTQAEWDSFFETEAEDWSDHSEKLFDLRERAGQDLAKIDADLASDLKKQSKDAARDLAKLDTDQSKQIAEIQKKHADDQRHEEKRRKIDALADERLFNFELRNLAAEGAANQIRQALERRAIEEQIAREKSEVESQIEDEKQRDEIARVKGAAEERRSELRQTAAEREQGLRDNAELEKAIRQEKLGTELAEEQEHYAELIQERRNYRDEKLAEIEADKQESIAKLSEELATAQDLTASELRELAPIAAQFGSEAAIAWGEGFTRGLETNQQLSDWFATDFTAPTRAGAGASTGLGHPGAIPGFQHGGRVPGPLGQPRLIMAHGGEEFNNPAMPRGGGGAQFSLVINNPTFGPGTNRQEIMNILDEWGQAYTDNVIVPALS